MITRQIIPALRADIEAALVAVAAKYNATMNLGLLKYSPNSATAQLEITTLTPEGKPRDVEAEAFIECATYLGLQQSDLGAIVKLSNKPHRIAGYLPKARKNCISVVDVATGKKYVTSVDEVKRSLSKLKGGATA